MSIHKRDTTRGPRYDVRIRDAAGKTHTKTFPRLADAERYERAKLTDRDRGEWLDPAARARTFADLAAEWLKSNPAKRSSTIGRDRAALDKHLLPALGDRRLGAIVPADVQAVVNTMAGRLAPSTVVRNTNTLAAIFRYAVDRDYLAKSPMRTVKRPKVPRTRARILSPDELARLADAHPAEYAPMVWLGALLGLRWGEVAALTVDDLDVLGRRVHVRRTLSRDEKGRTVVAEPKSDAGHRTVAMPAELAEVLAAHLAAAGLDASTPDALVFPAPAGGPLTAANWRRRVWWPAVLAAGLGTLTADEDGTTHYEGPGFHDLRRTSATALVVAGVDVKTAQTRLGHSQVRLTLELYAQAVDEAERKAAEVVGAHLMPARAATGTRDGRAMLRSVDLPPDAL